MDFKLAFEFCLFVLVGSSEMSALKSLSGIDLKKFKIPLPDFSQFLPMNLCRSDGVNTLRTYVACNGRIDCPDGSDETSKLCENNKCGPSLYRCDYGACIARNLVCNGRFDCADGSDEHTELCNGVECRVPYATAITAYYTEGCDGECGGIPAQDGTVLHYVCANNSTDTNLKLIKPTCRNGSWRPNIPACTGVASTNGGTSTRQKPNGSTPVAASTGVTPVVGSTTSISTATPDSGQTPEPTEAAAPLPM